MNQKSRFPYPLNRCRNAAIRASRVRLQRLEQRLATLEQTATPATRSARSGCGFTSDEDATSALAAIFLNLPRLTVKTGGQADFAASDATLLALMADTAGTAFKTTLHGISAVGYLMAHAGPQVEDGSVGPDTVEALGMLLAELGELSGMLVALEGNCRRALAQVLG